MEIVSLSQAKQLKLTRYFTGKPCKHGHIAERSTINRSCIECVVERNKAFFEQNKEKVRERKAEYQRKYRVKYAEKAKQSRQNWAEKNRIKDQQYKKAWRVENKAKVNSLTRKRQAAKMLRTPKWLTEDDLWMMEEAYELAVLRTSMTGVAWHVDHIIPLQGDDVSGLHVPANLQVIPGYENIRKGNKVVDYA